MGIVLSGGTVVTAADCCQADVRIEGEQVAAIGINIRRPEDDVLNVDGCYLFPGGIDPHTHFDMPAGDTVTADDFASGTKAAVLGGTTTIIDYVTQFGGETLSHALSKWRARAEGRCHADYGFHIGITGWNREVSREMEKMVREEGIPSFKFYMAYKNVLQVDDGALLQALIRAREAGALICVHCENGDIIHQLVSDARARGGASPQCHPLTRPIEAEVEAVFRAVTLARVARAPLYIVHLSCRRALRVVQEAKGEGAEVYAETCPQYLLLDDSLYQAEGFEGAKYVMSPPLRHRDNQQALWRGLQTGALDTVATDHCSFNFNGQKDLGRADFSSIPGGIPGVETRMGLLYTYGVVPGRISLNRFVDITSTRAARLFGLFPRKGTIAAGSDADIVVWDPGASSVISARTQHQRVDYTPYEGFAQAGKAVHVFLRGRQVVRDGRLIDDMAGGIYLFRSPFI
ncbi:MAG: dihydropyrimidinase [Bacillota bacterium]